MAIVTKTFTVAKIGASKANVVASDIVPASITPDALTVTLQNADSYRQVEIDKTVTQLRDFCIENDFTEEVTAVQLSMPIGGTKAQIESGVSGDSSQIILQYSDEGGNDYGTEIFTAMVEYVRMYMRDNYLKLL